MHLHRIVPALSVCLLLSTAHASQPAPLPAERAVISADNAAQLEPLAALPLGARRALFSPDGRELLISTTWEAAAYTLPDLTPSETFMGAAFEGAGACCLSADGRYLILYREAGVELYDSETGTSAPLPSDVDGATEIAIIGGDAPEVLYTLGEGYGSETSPVWVRLTADGERVEAEVANQFGSWLALSEDEAALATTGTRLHLHDLAEGGTRQPLDLSAFGDTAFRPGFPGQIAFGSARLIVLYDDEQGTTLEIPLPAADTAHRLAFSPDGALLAAYGRELEGMFGTPPRFHLFDAESGALLLDVPDYHGTFAFSPDGTLLLVSDRDTTTWLLGIAE